MREYFTPSMDFDSPEPRHKLCGQWGAVTLQQRGKDNFLVRYGRQCHEELNYGQAAMELGSCLMHQLACDGKLDNRTKGER